MAKKSAAEKQHTRPLTKEELAAVKADKRKDRNLVVAEVKAASALRSSGKIDFSFCYTCNKKQSLTKTHMSCSPGKLPICGFCQEKGMEASNESSINAASTTGSKKKKVKRAGTKFGAKKGKQFEREIATALGHIFPDAQRMLEYQGSNVIGTDLENTDIFRFQCKCTANYKNPNAIFEIREKGPHVPVLVTKANNRPPMVVLPFQEFVTLLEMAYGHRERLINPYVGKEKAVSHLADNGQVMVTLPAPTDESKTRVFEAEFSLPVAQVTLPPLKEEKPNLLSSFL